MAEILKLVPDQKPVDENALKRAEELLELVRAGEIDGVAVVALHRDGSTSSGYGGAISYSMLGRLYDLQQRLHGALDES